MSPLGIPVIADLPGVGAELNDHYFARVILRCKEPLSLNDAVRQWHRGAAAVLRYALFRRGYFAIPALSAGCFLRALPSSATPDVQCSLALYSVQNIGETLHPFSGVTGVCTLLRPESRGFVRIKSADPADAPAIHPNYLGAQRDRDTMVAGMKALRTIVQSPAMARHIAEEVEPGPACANDEDILDYVRRRGSTVYHPVSTCRMGQDDRAVVDERLRVRGFAGFTGDRCVDHAGGGVGQHQRRDHHDRREGRGHGAGGCKSVIFARQASCRVSFSARPGQLR